MLRKIAILTIILAQVVYTQAQEIKFGVHVDPIISFLDSDYSKVSGDGVNGGVELGVELEYPLNDGGNFGITFGADFAINRGGTLEYAYGTVLFRNSELDNIKKFKNVAGNYDATQGAVDVYAFTRVNYRLNYVEIPIGLKLRTDELGGSYMRAVFHIPLIKIGIPVTAGAKIFAPTAEPNGFAQDDRNPNKYGIPQSSTEGDGYIEEPNIWKDITPVQISVGAGAGIEFAPTDPDGLRLYAMIYYTTGLLDVTGGFLPKQDFTEIQENTMLGGGVDQTLEVQSRNPRNAMHNISLRIGCIF